MGFRETNIVSGFVVHFVTVMFGSHQLPAVPDEAVMRPLFFVGVAAPMTLNNYFDSQQSDSVSERWSSFIFD